MRVAFVSGTYHPVRDGVSHYVQRLKLALSKEGLDPIVLTTVEAARRAEDEQVVGVVKGWGAGMLPALTRAIRGSAADVVHIQHAAGSYHSQRAVLALPLVLRATGWRRPIVSTVHEYGWWDWQPAYLPPALLGVMKRWGERRAWWDGEDAFLLTLSDSVIATHETSARHLVDRLPSLAERLVRIPIGANVSVASWPRQAARQATCREAGWPQGCPIIAYFGFLHPVKGLETLLEAFGQLLTALPAARLLLLGGVESSMLRGEEAERYREELRVRTLVGSLMGKVHMTGYLAEPELSRYLTGADVGVLPFKHGLTLKSGSLLALLAHGLPVVGTASVGGDAELEGEPSVRLVPRQDPHALAQALLQWLPPSEEPGHLRRRAQAFAAGFSWEGIAERHLRLYRRLSHHHPSHLGDARPAPI
ncbi:MAG: glycosyltransferase [Actinomycetota bacterium]|nr:glycosyltransferase [Actinomycetota bacterium]